VGDMITNDENKERKAQRMCFYLMLVILLFMDLYKQNEILLRVLNKNRDDKDFINLMEILIKDRHVSLQKSFELLIRRSDKFKELRKLDNCNK
jgi:hypothetical protein